MNNLLTAKYLACFVLLGLFITSCSKEEMAMDSPLKISNATTVTTSDMVGTWNLSKMMADVEVDLDSTAGGSKNLLDETTCFDTMSISFDADGTFESNNAMMTFEAGDGDDFSCLSDRMDSGTWTVTDNKLMLTLDVNNVTYTHEKEITLGTDDKTGESTFALDVTKIESNQYVSDPGNTRASEITILMVEYTKS